MLTRSRKRWPNGSPAGALPSNKRKMIALRCCDSTKRQVPWSTEADVVHRYLLHRVEYERYIHWDEANPRKYTRNLIFKNEYMDVLLMCWPPHCKSAIHDHEESSCFVVRSPAAAAAAAAAVGIVVGLRNLC